MASTNPITTEDIHAEITEKPEDTELDCLLRDNKVEIDALRILVKDVITDQYDDVWLLRYVLSNKTAKESEEPLRFMINWRASNKEALENIKNGGSAPNKDIISQFQVVGPHGKTSDGNSLNFVRIGLCNTKGLMDTVPYEDVLNFFMLSKEEAFLSNDAATRKEGRLIKSVTVLDFTGFSVTRGNDKRFSKILGETSKTSEKCYPQFSGRSIMINTPKVFGWLFGLMKPLMSKRALEKVVFCPGSSGGDIANCPFLSRYLPVDNVPTFLGGNCNCAGGCIGGVPNSQTTALVGITEDGMKQITIDNRATQTLEIPVVKGSVVSGSFKVEARKVFFEVNLAIDGEKDQILVAKRKLNAEDGVVEEEFTIPSNGLLKIVADNSHSMFRSKQFFYLLDITTPEM